MRNAKASNIMMLLISSHEETNRSPIDLSSSFSGAKVKALYAARILF
jgi:hypothetical protein